MVAYLIVLFDPVTNPAPEATGDTVITPDLGEVGRHVYTPPERHLRLVRETQRRRRQGNLIQPVEKAHVYADGATAVVQDWSPREWELCRRSVVVTLQWTAETPIFGSRWLFYDLEDVPTRLLKVIVTCELTWTRGQAEYRITCQDVLRIAATILCPTSNISPDENARVKRNLRSFARRSPFYKSSANKRLRFKTIAWNELEPAIEHLLRYYAFVDKHTYAPKTDDQPADPDGHRAETDLEKYEGGSVHTVPALHRSLDTSMSTLTAECYACPMPLRPDYKSPVLSL